VSQLAGKPNSVRLRPP